MWTKMILATVLITSHLLDGVEDLAVEELVAHFRVETFPVAAFPRRARFDIHRLRSSLFQPFAQIARYEPGSVV